MKKIMFNDKYGLTQAVIEGRKTMTRRFLAERYDDVFCNEDDDWVGEITRMVKLPYPDCKAWRKDRVLLLPKYKVGELVAVAQNYQDVYEELKRTHGSSSRVTREFFHKYVQGGRMPISNKMFVRADLMPHHIRFTSIKAERLQDISDKDCLREGIQAFDTPDGKTFVAGGVYVGQDARLKIAKGMINIAKPFKTPQEAFAVLIDRVSGKGTWESNPWVFVYEFKLVD